MSGRANWPRAILLDFYGTVVEEDDAPIAAVCRQIAGASSMSPTPEEVASHWWRVMGEMCRESHGAGFRLQRDIEIMSLDATLRHFDARLDCEALSRAIFEYWERPAIFPESKDVIGNCAVPVCLVTNIDNADLDCALKHHGLSFDMIATSEDCRAYKPRPEPFRRALSSVGLSAEQVLHVGDSLTADVRGAKALGIPVLWINRKNRNPPAGREQPDYTSADLRGVAGLLEGRVPGA